MKLLIVNPTGGAPKYGPNLRSYNIARALITNVNVSVDILSNGFFHKFNTHPNTDRLIVHEDIDGVKYTWLKGYKYEGRGFGQMVNQFLFAVRSFKHLFFTRLTGIDVVVYSSPTPFAYIGTYLICKLYRKRIIFEVRDLWPMVIKEIGNYSSSHPLIILLEVIARFAYRTSDHIIVVKPGDVEYLVDAHSISRHKISYVPNGYTFSRPPAIIKSKNVNRDIFTIGYVGSLSSAYAIENLIEAINILKDENIQLLVYGDGPDLLKLKALTNDYMLSNVSFEGRISFTEVASAMTLIDVGYVGYKEAAWLKHGISSNKIFDYMASGVPIISAVETDYNPVLSAGCGITVKPESPAELASAIRTMMNLSHEEREVLGSNGLEYLRLNHNFNLLSKRIINLFESL